MRLPFTIRLWFYEMSEKIAWRIAYLIPRKIALLCFVRVCAATGDSPSDITYESAYKAYERGVGR